MPASPRYTKREKRVIANVFNSIKKKDAREYMLKQLGVERPYPQCRRMFSKLTPDDVAIDLNKAGVPVKGKSYTEADKQVIFKIFEAPMEINERIAWLNYAGFTDRKYEALRQQHSLMKRQLKKDEPTPATPPVEVSPTNIMDDTAEPVTQDEANLLLALTAN